MRAAISSLVPAAMEKQSAQRGPVTEPMSLPAQARPKGVRKLLLTGVLLLGALFEGVSVYLAILYHANTLAIAFFAALPFVCIFIGLLRSRISRTT